MDATSASFLKVKVKAVFFFFFYCKIMMDAAVTSKITAITLHNT